MRIYGFTLAVWCGPVRRSKPDLRSFPERRSPTTLICSRVRVSTPLRRSLPDRRSILEGLLIAMAIAPEISHGLARFEGEPVNPRF